MKAKNIKIKIEPLDKWFDRIGKDIKDISRAKFKKTLPTVSFENLTIYRQTLTTKRLELLSTVKHKKPSSIYELAKMLNRDRRAVATDIKILKNLGFIEIKKEHKIRELARPIVDFDKINIGITL